MRGHLRGEFFQYAAKIQRRQIPSQANDIEFLFLKTNTLDFYII